MGSISSATASPDVSVETIDEMSERVARWLKDKGDYKSVARILGADPRNVQYWFAGNMPRMKVFARMAEVWGEPFLEYVFAPVLQESDISLEKRLLRIEADLEAVRDWAKTNETHSQSNPGPQTCRSGRVDRQTGAASSEDSSFFSQARKAAKLSIVGLAIGATLLSVANDDDFSRISRTARTRGGRIELALQA